MKCFVSCRLLLPLLLLMMMIASSRSSSSSSSSINESNAYHNVGSDYTMIVSASSTPTSTTTTTTTTTTITSNDRDNIQYDIYNKGKTTLSYTRIFMLPRIEASIYEQYNPMKDNMSNWLVVSRAATPSFIRRETWREFRDIRYNLSIQHGSYEGDSHYGYYDNDISILTHLFTMKSLFVSNQTLDTSVAVILYLLTHSFTYSRLFSW